MRTITIVMLALIGFCNFSNPLRAEQSSDCKECRESLRACTQAHSQQTCKMEYDRCMKICQRK
jgi:hypothetical protein